MNNLIPTPCQEVMKIDQLKPHCEQYESHQFFQN